MQTGFLLFFITVSVSFAIAYIAILEKLKTVNVAFVQLYMAHKTMEDLVESNMPNIFEQTNDAHKENFIKFLSESRDWAFEYIEQTQTVVQEVVDYLNNKDNDFDKAYAKKLQVLLAEERKQ